MENEKLNYYQIIELRNELEKQLESIDLEDDKHIKLDLDKDVLEQIIFNTNIYGMRTFALDFNLIKRLDLTDISFDNVDIVLNDFSGSYGVKINPQTIWDKNFYGTILTDATIIGSFDDCYIRNTNFTGSVGAKINPQTIFNKDFTCTVLKDTEIIGSFNEGNIIETDFTGSKGAVINLQTVKILIYANLTDAKIISSFDRRDITRKKEDLSELDIINDKENNNINSVRKRTL